MSASRTILVVEDNPLTRKMLRVALETEGYRVLEAGDGREATAAAMREPPALVVQDIILPDMNGFEVLRRLRALPGGAETPILALSGFLSRVEEAKAIEAGFTHVLIKPMEPSRLLDTIQPYFPTRVREERRGGGRRVVVADDDPVQLKLCRMHLERSGFEVTTCTSSAEALHALRTGEADALLSDVVMPELDGFELCFEVRQDLALRRLPVVLVSAWYLTETDQALARRVGANALVLRTSDLRGVTEALLKAIQQGAPEAIAEPTVEMKLEHAKAVIRQLERRVLVGSDLARRCTLQAAQISLLSGVADALTHSSDGDAALRDVVAATLDAAGISKGALFLLDSEGSLEMRHAIGFTLAERDGLEDFYGHLWVVREAIDRQATIAVPSTSLPEPTAELLLRRTDVSTLQIVPLISEGRGAGAMILAAKRTDVTNEDAIAFARAMGNQLAQSLQLASSVGRLAASEAKYRTVTEAASDAISILTPEGIVRDVNPRFEQILGVSRGEIIGRHIRDFSPAEHQDDDVHSFHEAVATHGRTTPRPMRRKDGSTFLLEFSGQNVTLDGENLVVSIGRDVTEQVKAQAQLLVSDRMASVGTLAAGVAHEINNPLAAAMANIDFARRDVTALGERFGAVEVGDLPDILRDAWESVERVRDIVRDLKLFSRGEEDKRGPVDVERVLESSLRIAWNEVRHRAQLIKEYGVGLPMVEANESRLGQVFLNLIVNAAQSFPDGHAEHNRIVLRTVLAPSGRVVVEVEDNGPGIPPEVLKKLFTPFFTTKAPGVGTGLGLSICYRIIASLDGQITVDSKVGRGTVFRIDLPRATQEHERTPAPVLSLPAPPRRGRILVIDDEPMILTAIRRMFAAEHDVTGTANAAEALGWIEAGEQYDVTICDLMMPAMTGMEFFDRLTAAAPALAERVIFLVGGAFTHRGARVPGSRPEPAPRQAVRGAHPAGAGARAAEVTRYSKRRSRTRSSRCSTPLNSLFSRWKTRSTARPG